MVQRGNGNPNGNGTKSRLWRDANPKGKYNVPGDKQSNKLTRNDGSPDHDHSWSVWNIFTRKSYEGGHGENWEGDGFDASVNKHPGDDHNRH